MGWTAALVADGIAIAPTADGDVDLSLGAHRGRFTLVRIRRSPRPGRMPSVEPDGILHLPHVSERAAALLEAAGHSYVTDDGAAFVQFPDGYQWRTSVGSEGAADGVRQPLWSTGTSRVVHALLLSPPREPVKQTWLASVAGMTQANVSGIVRSLASDGLVETIRGRPVVHDQASLLDQWLVKRRFEPVTTYWSSGRALPDTLDAVTALLPGPVAVSGDVAVDAVAPYRRPGQLVVLAQSGTLRGDALLPVPDAGEADVVLTVTNDPVIWASTREVTWLGRAITRADSLQVLWDLSCSHGVDTRDAVAQWRIALNGARS